MMARISALGALLVLTAFGLSCSDNKSTPTTPETGSPVPSVTAVGLKIYGAPSTSIGLGQTIYLRAVELMNNGGTHAVPSGVQWTSSAAGVASVSPDGSVIALAPGTVTITGSYLTHSAAAVIRVVSNWTDLDFRVAIVNGTTTPKPASDVQRIFDTANDLMFERTGAHMRLLDMQDFGPDTASRLATRYLESWTGEQPDGILIWLEDETAVSFGGYAQALTRPAPYSNRYPPTSGANRLFVAAIHYDHKYARCGYDDRGENRIGDRSANGECRNQAGLTCVNNGRFWECPGVRNDLYGQPDVFTAGIIVHEFMHPVGFAGNDDHYGTQTCIARVGMSSAEANDLARSQWHLGQCPDLFPRFRPAGVPNASGRLSGR